MNDRETKLLFKALLTTLLITLFVALFVFVMNEVESEGVIKIPQWFKWFVSIVVWWVYGKYGAKPIIQLKKEREERGLRGDK